MGIHIEQFCNNRGEVKKLTGCKPGNLLLVIYYQQAGNQEQRPLKGQDDWTVLTDDNAVITPQIYSEYGTGNESLAFSAGMPILWRIARGDESDDPEWISLDGTHGHLLKMEISGFDPENPIAGVDLQSGYDTAASLTTTATTDVIYCVGGDDDDWDVNETGAPTPSLPQDELLVDNWKGRYQGHSTFVPGMTRDLAISNKTGYGGHSQTTRPPMAAYVARDVAAGTVSNSWTVQGVSATEVHAIIAINPGNGGARKSPVISRWVNGDNGGSTCTIDLTANHPGPTAGNLLLAFVADYRGSSSGSEDYVETPAGWTELDQQNQSNPAYPITLDSDLSLGTTPLHGEASRRAIFWKVSDGTEALVTFQQWRLGAIGTGSHAVQVLELDASMVDTSNPFRQRTRHNLNSTHGNLRSTYPAVAGRFTDLNGVVDNWMVPTPDDADCYGLLYIQNRESHGSPLNELYNFGPYWSWHQHSTIRADNGNEPASYIWECWEVPKTDDEIPIHIRFSLSSNTTGRIYADMLWLNKPNQTGRKTKYVDYNIPSTEPDADLTDFPNPVDLSAFPQSFWDNVTRSGENIRVWKKNGDEVPVQPVGVQRSPTFVADGSGYMLSPTLGNVLSKTVRVVFHNPSFDLSKTGYLFCQGGLTGNSREIGIWLVSGKISGRFGGENRSTVYSASNLTARYGSVINPKWFAFEIDMNTGDYFLEDENGTFGVDNATVNSGRIDGMPFMIGARGDTDDPLSTVGGYIAQAGLEFGEVDVYLDGVLERTYIPDGGTASTWTESVNGQNGTLYGAPTDGSQWGGNPKTGQLHFRTDLSVLADNEFEIHLLGPEHEGYGHNKDDWYGQYRVWEGYELVSHDGGYSDATGKNTLSVEDGDPSLVNSGGILGGYSSFDGTDDRYQSGLEPNGQSAITMQGWARATQFSGDDMVFLGGSPLTADGLQIKWDVGKDDFEFYVKASGASAGTASFNRTTAGVSVGDWYKHDGVWSDGNPASVYINGVKGTDTAALTGTLDINVGRDLSIGGMTYNGSYREYFGDVSHVRVRYDALSADWISTEHKAFTSSSWATIADAQGGTPGNYSLDLLAGTVTLSGGEVDLTYTPNLQNYSLELNSGTVTVGGLDISLSASRTIDLLAGAVTVEGGDLLLTNLRVFSIDLESGSVTLVGNDVITQAQRFIHLDEGQIDLSGADINLTYNQTLNNYELELDAGTVTLTGEQLGFLLGRTISLESGSVQVVGEINQMVKDSILALESGTINISGRSTILLRQLKVELEAGNIDLEGAAVILQANRLINLEEGELDITGGVVTLTSTGGAKVISILGIQILGVAP